MNDTGFIFLIGRVRKAIRRDFERRIAHCDLTAPQFHVLYRLWMGDGIPTSALACDVDMDGGTITGLLDRLEARGLVRRERSSEDRRTVILFLTDKGRAMHRELSEVLDHVSACALEGLGAADRATLARLLERVGENLGS